MLLFVLQFFFFASEASILKYIIKDLYIIAFPLRQIIRIVSNISTNLSVIGLSTELISTLCITVFL